jgi:hypothetical protein
MIAVILVVVALYMLTTVEPFTETFGLSGYTKPVDVVKLNDPRPNLDGYTKMETVVTNDSIELFVQKTNAEIMKRTGISTYIIETTAVNAYKSDENDLYECMFMVMKQGGFSFGFSVVASFEVKGSDVRLISLRSQPLNIDAPSTIKPFVGDGEGKAFIEYNLVNVNRMPKRSEFEMAKNKLQ